MSDQQKLSERLYAKFGDEIENELLEVEELETQLAEARKAAKGVGHDWLGLMEERDGYKAERDALAKALRFIMSELNLVKDMNPEAWAEFYNEIVMETPNQRFSEAWKEADNALNAAIDRTAPADGGK